MKTIRTGVWPTMITPFTVEGEIDYESCEALVARYARQGADGIFACCQSSEMFYLSLGERVRLARFVTACAKRAGMQVVVSGHTADGIAAQIEECKAISDGQEDAMVLVTNRLAEEGMSEDTVRRNLQVFFDTFPDMTFGLYECPYPYKRLLSAELLRWCAQSGRIAFMKDTSCDTRQIQEKVQAVQGTGLMLFNANTATLLETLRAGVAGFSGIMANLHADLYARLIRWQRAGDDRADWLQSLLSTLGLFGCQNYPINAKYYLMLEGLPIGIHTRTPHPTFSYAMRREVEHMRAFVRWISAQPQMR